MFMCDHMNVSTYVHRIQNSSRSPGAGITIICDPINLDISLLSCLPKAQTLGLTAVSCPTRLC